MALENADLNRPIITINYCPRMDCLSKERFYFRTMFLSVLGMVQDGMAIDSANRQLYVTDAANNASITVINLSELRKKVVLNLPRSKPRAIALHVARRYHFKDNVYLFIK